jgi:hypothetical protein
MPRVTSVNGLVSTVNGKALLVRGAPRRKTAPAGSRKRCDPDAELDLRAIA